MHTRTPEHSNPGAEKDGDSTCETCWTPRTGWQWPLWEAAFTTSRFLTPVYDIPLLVIVRLTFSGLRLSLRPQPHVRLGASQAEPHRPLPRMWLHCYYLCANQPEKDGSPHSLDPLFPSLA